MSDTSQGEGWWQANDGKWYPAESHPDYRPPPPRVPDYRPPPPLSALGKPPFWRRPWVIISAVIVALIISGVIINAVDDDGDTSSADVSSGPDIVSWSIIVSGDVVKLTGELPNGYPTETYLNGELVDRDVGGDFGWNLEKGVPEPLSLQDGMSCAELVADWEFWISGADSSTVQDSTLRQLAYAQNAINLHAERGC